MAANCNDKVHGGTKGRAHVWRVRLTQQCDPKHPLHFALACGGNVRVAWRRIACFNLRTCWVRIYVQHNDAHVCMYVIMYSFSKF